MRVFIRWIFFENKDLSKLIFNDVNNENWPNANTYAETVKDWHNQIDNQQKEINQLEIKNNRTRELMAGVQTWFVKEHNLLGKPAKRALLEKERENI